MRDPLLSNGFANKYVPMATFELKNEERCFLCSPCKCVISKPILEFSQLWDSSRPLRTWTRKLRDLRRWKPLPDNEWWRHSRLRRLSTCCSELLSVWISDNARVTCSYNMWVFNKCNLPIQPPSVVTHSRDNIFLYLPLSFFTPRPTSFFGSVG
jgi:hypothetical protein